jgi:SAM-dependent methyltransferase
MEIHGEDAAGHGIRELLARDDDPSRPSLENRVAYDWERGLDTLGYRNARLRDETLLSWASDVLSKAPKPCEVVDVGCAYGNFLLMLHARLPRGDRVRLTGLDIDDRALAYGRAFSTTMSAYENCRFLHHDITRPLPFDSASVDVVVAADVIEHLPDVSGAFREIARTLRPEGRLLVSTPLPDSLFKRAAAFANRVTADRLNRAYYRGKDTDLDEHGRPRMQVHAGHEHISEMRYRELMACAARSGLTAIRVRFMPVMSGSRWFDAHPFVLAALLAVEALHETVQLPSWAHGVCVELRKG